jgi:RimJ/RimL family protein N-acetyltransferase
MTRLTFEALHAHRELIDAMVAGARRERSKAIGALIARALRWLMWREPARPARAAVADGCSLRPAQGTAKIAIRTARSGDRDRVQALVRGLSPKSRHLRFFSGIRELSPRWLERFTRDGTGDEVTLLALAPIKGEEIAVGMAQYAGSPHRGHGEFAIVVADDWQGMGIATRLINQIVCVSRKAGVTRLEGEVLAENQRMLRLARGLGFRIEQAPDNPMSLRAYLAVSDPRWQCA